MTTTEEIRLSTAEIEKFRAESAKLQAERDKLLTEQLKLALEMRWYPWVAMIGLSAAVGAIVAKLFA